MYFIRAFMIWFRQSIHKSFSLHGIPTKDICITEKSVDTE